MIEMCHFSWRGRVSIASINRPRNPVVNDDPDDLEERNAVVQVEEVPLGGDEINPEIPPPASVHEDDPPAGAVNNPPGYVPPGPEARDRLRRQRGRNDSDESTFRAEYSSDAESRNPPPPRRRVAGRQPNIPPIERHLLPLVEALTADLERETRGSGSPNAFFPPDFHQAAETLVRYRLSTLQIIRQTDKDARRMFLADLRDLGRKAFPEMQLLMQLFSHFSPVLKQRTILKDPHFEEVVLPVRLKEYMVDLISLGGYLKPNQLMANYVSKELAKGRVQIPSYTPYIDFPLNNLKGSSCP